MTGIICKFDSGWRRNRFGDRKFPCQQTWTKTSRVTIFVRRTNQFYCFNRLFGTKYGQVNLVESRISLKNFFLFLILSSILILTNFLKNLDLKMILAAKWIKMVQMYIFMWLIAQLEKYCHIRMNGWKGIECIISFPDINFFNMQYFEKGLLSCRESKIFFFVFHGGWKP